MNFSQILLLVMILILSSCSQKQSHIESESKYSDEILEKLGITNEAYLSAASKRALEWPEIGNEWFFEYSTQDLKGDLEYEEGVVRRDPSAIIKVEGKYFLSGHTHLPRIDVFGDKIYCNPGSVGQPRDNDNRAAFATFDGQKFQLHRVEYDINEVGRLMEKAGFSGYYYGCLKTGARNLQWAEEQNV